MSTPAGGGHVTSVRFSFVDPINGDQCELVIPAGGRVYPDGEAPKIGVDHPGCTEIADLAPKIGVDHPGCTEIADLALHIDAWFCPACGRSGRIAGNWALDLIDAAR